MQDASEWLICEYNHLVGPKVWEEFLGGAFHGSGRLLYYGVLGFYINHCFGHIVNEPLFFVFYMKK